jgi:hypothetical protein
MLGAQGEAVDTPRLPAGDGPTLGALLLRAAERAGYGGPGAFVYAAGRLGSGLSPALMREAVPADPAACEALAARHGVAVDVLWDLLVEDRPAG